MLITVMVGKCNGQAVKFRYGQDELYKPVPPCKLEWTESQMDLETFCEFTKLLAKKGWVYKTTTKTKEEPVIVKFIWDELLEGPAYVVFKRSDKIVAMFKHENAGTLRLYKKSDITEIHKMDIRDMVKEYEQHPNYEDLIYGGKK